MRSTITVCIQTQIYFLTNRKTMRKIFYFLSVALFTVGCSADPDSTWTSKMNETWARQADFRQNFFEYNTPTSDWSAERNSSYEKRWNWFYNWRADYVQQKIESYENLVSFMELDEIPSKLIYLLSFFVLKTFLILTS